MVDPIDGTNGLLTALKDQATGIIVADSENNFLAGGVGSLVDSETVLVEKGQPLLLEFDERGGSLFQVDFPPRKLRGIESASFATLKQRMPPLRETELFKRRLCPDLLSFGGFALLSLLRGQIDCMLDPFKGQPPREAVLWGWMAQKCGLVVSDEKGRLIDFPQILEQMHQAYVNGEGEEGLPRVKMVISTHQTLHEQILRSLRPTIEEGVVFEEQKNH